MARTRSFSEYDNYYDWYADQQAGWNEQWPGGGIVGGAGDLGFGNMYTGGGQTYDCATQGPAYNSAGVCIACCP